MQKVTIDFYRESNPVVNDAYDRLVSKIPKLNRERGYKLFTITGCEPGVGSTTIAISIAVALATSGYRTLLVDADMRKQPEKKRLSADNTQKSYGLSDVLQSVTDCEEAACETNIPGLFYMTCGTEIENPVSLLNSECMTGFVSDVTGKYDYIIFDSPALNTTIDAAVISAKTSGAILVAEYMKTKKKKIEVAVRELEQAGGSLIGIVLNNVARKDYKRYIENYDYFVPKKGRK